MEYLAYAGSVILSVFQLSLCKIGGKRVFFKEKLNAVQIVDFLLGVASVVLLKI